MSLPLSVQRRLLTRHHTPIISATVTPWLQLQHQHPKLNSITTRAYSAHSSKSHTRPSSSAQPTAKTTVTSSTSTSSTSTSSTSTSSTSTSSTSTSTTSLANDINPPPSTLPADLNLPTTLPASAAPSDKLKRYIALGRAYLSFYKTGLKNVYHNYRASLPLRRALGLTSYLPTSPPPNPAHKAASTAFRAALHRQNLSRANFQLIRRAAYDVRRMIPFSLILVVCGEMTPLAVLFFGNVVTPLTCRVPKQIEKERAKRIAAKRDAVADHVAAVEGAVTGPVAGSEGEMEILTRCFANPRWIETAREPEVVRACAALGLVKSRASPGWLVGPVYRGRLRRFAEYLELDDGLIRKCGGVKAMEGNEVRIAVEERGGVGMVDGLEGWEAERVQRRWLEQWLEKRA